MEQRFCHLDAALGRSTDCRQDECPLWKDGRCVLEAVDLAHNACLVTALVGMRASLERQREPLRDFHPPGLV